jgi:predicted RNA binding protein YcfA (HicA-like mRNA interferase family)
MNSGGYCASVRVWGSMDDLPGADRRHGAGKSAGRRTRRGGGVINAKGWHPIAVPTAWDNKIAARFMPKRYTSRELIKLAEEFGWRLVGVRGDHHNFKHPASRFIVTIVHPQKDVPVGRAVDTVKKIRLEIK